MAVNITTSAPGSIMVTGEHAVVYGYPSIVVAIDQRIRVEATSIDTPTIEILSDISEPVSMPLSDITVKGPMRFVLSAVEIYRNRLKSGLRLKIVSNINPTLGLGSSAAVTIACIGAVRLACGLSIAKSEKQLIHTQALGIIRRLQGRGSGADLAAALYGGAISYKLPEAMITGDNWADGEVSKVATLPEPPPISLCYSGYKTPTGEVLAKIADAMKEREAYFQTVYKRMGKSAQLTIDAAKVEDWTRGAKHLNEYQLLMKDLGVSDEVMDSLVQKANNTDGVLAAKISGSGLGDCVLSVGDVPDGFDAVQIAGQGLRQDV